MRSSRRTEVSLKSSAQQLTDHNIGTELTTAWKSLAQSKAALRHIENRIEATPGTGVLLDSVITLPKKKSSRTVRCRDGQQVDDRGGSSKSRSGSQQSPEKSSSRSPLRNTTQDSNVRRSSSVEFREPLASYREATPPPHPSSQLEAYSLQSVPGSSHPSSPPPSDPLPSQLVYHRDTRDKQTDRDLDSTHSSALESTEVRYLNDQSALETLRTVQNTPKAQLGMDSQESSPCVAPTPGSARRGDSTPSTSPGSASQRLENLRRHQPDDKLEKLKERIRRQRQHLEEAAEREKLLGSLEQPAMATVESNGAAASNMPTAKIRKVAAAPPAPVYKGFSNTETKIRTADGKVWKEEDFHNLSREIYKDLSRQFAESTRTRHQQQKEHRADRSKERRPPKPVRKVHRAAPAFDLNAKTVISPASWREGQKLVKMVLGSGPKLPREEDSPYPADRASRTASHHRSDPRSESHSRSRPNSTERPRSGFQGQPRSRPAATPVPSSAAQEKTPVGVSTDLLSADIQGILDDLQLECTAAEKEEERARKRSRGGSGGRRGRGGSGSRTRTPVSFWGTNAPTNSSSRGCRSASPTTHRPETSSTAEAGRKKRHYDADTVRQYIARQQEERKRRQAEEKRAMREETERRNQRLQELYRKQREAAKTVALPSEAPVAPVQKRLQETFNKLLLEEAQLGEEATHTTQRPAPSIQMRPMYQPSGESDKENKRLEAPQSPSSSDRSLNDQPPPPLSRNDLDVGVASLLQPDRLSPAVRPTAAASSSARAAAGENLFSQLLRLETAVAVGDLQHTLRPATAPSSRSRSKMSRIEALKATATSLSKRIESEARKLAGEGINYGAATSMDIDPILTSKPSTRADGCWAERAAENSDMTMKIQRILNNTGHSSYNGTALPGVSSLHAFKEQKEKNGAHTGFNSPHTASADAVGPILNSYTQERRRLVNGLEKEERLDKAAQKKQSEEHRTDLHDSSASSLSEGPLLSEGSFSEDEVSPPRPSSSRVPKSADRLEAADYSVRQRKDYQRLFDFQREAAMCPVLSPPQHDSSRAPFEELNKGSPLSVINIFLKNLHGQVKVSGRNSETNSPSAHSLHSGHGPGDAAVYEDDFVSSHSSKATGPMKRGSSSPSTNSHFEELMRRSPYEKSTGGLYSHHSSFHSSNHSPHLSSGSTSGSSPHSRHSARKRGAASDQSDATLVEEQRSSCSPPSEALSSDSRKKGSDRSSAHSQARSVHSNDTLGETSGHSHQRPRLASPSGAPDPASPPGPDSHSEPLRSGPNTSSSAHGGRAEARHTGELQYSPAVLQQRMAAELHYLESIEESMRQLGDVERLMGVSMAKQESATLAQMLKAKQQQHERDLYELKIKTEREALEAELQMEENRQRVARAHLELQESLAATQKETLEGLQESTTKMMSQQAEAARYTADAARHIKEMAELTRSQIAGTVIVPPVATDSSMFDQREEQESSYTKQRHDKADSDSFLSEVSSRRTRSEEPLSSLNSLSHSDSLSFKRPNISGSASSSHHSPSHVSSDTRERTKKEVVEGKRRTGGVEERPEAASSSVEEEVPTAANDTLCSDSIPSMVDEKADSMSVATEYSLKFDESMTEDEIEERSFRSLLPSEAHRRGTLEKKSRHHEESEDDGANHNTTLVSASGLHNSLKDVNITFSGGQESFSQFTMDMVRQYMKDEEVRLQHQSSLLHLRQKALKEKTRTELAWLEHQKKRLRDKGEDDKMPPIRKKQRGLLMKLQQEQAEIKRLQEANKAARKERQLLLKQQEEIERMRNSTLRLKERLKCAGGEAPPETPVSELPESEPASPSMRHPDDVRSPSPSLSISGSETSSIMQKLKKMRSHMDEKHCSPVHYFLSVFTAHHWASLSVCLPNLHPKFQLFIYNQLVRFLTKREQQLMQRRHHAEELLQWKQRLDQEEAEVRRMEKEALAVWDQNTPRDKDLKMSESQEKEVSDISSHHSHHRSSEPRTDSEKEYVSEGDYSSETPDSSIRTEGLGSQQQRSPPSAQPASVPETPLASVQSSPANYTQDFTSGSQSPGRKSSPLKGSHSPAASSSDASSRTKMQVRSTSRTPNQACTQPTDPPMVTQTETISDQSDIESRIKALKEELRKRKFMAYQLKKEQKKRNKERLKAQEASLLKQLENYNNFIEKTKAELNKEPDSTPDTNSQIKESSSVLEQSYIKSPPNRSETSKISDSERTLIHAALHRDALPQPDYSRSTSVPGDLSNDEPQTVTPTVAASGSTEDRSRPSTKALLRPRSKEDITESADESIVSDHRSDVQEELEMSSRVEDENSQHFLKLEREDGPDFQERLSTSKHVSSSMDEEQRSQSVSLEQDKELKQEEISEGEQAVKLNLIDARPPKMDLETSPHPASSSSAREGPFSSNKEAPIKDNEASPVADGYHDDFESSLDSSPREEHRSSKLESHVSLSPTEIKVSRKDSSSRATPDSQDEVVEEDIAEELSYRSDASEASRQSERLFDLQEKTDDFKHDNHSPPISPLQTPLSPIVDEMLSFTIGDRVLVGGVQPGTLRFKGPTSFANGFWAGVELDKSEGSNNGTYDGVVYFECEESHGIFAPPDKISHLPDKFEIYTDTTEDEDSFFDDSPDKGESKRKTDEDNSQKQADLGSRNEQTSCKDAESEDKKVTNESLHKSQTPQMAKSHLNSQHHKESKHPVSNGNTRDIMLDFEDASHTLIISDMDKVDFVKQSKTEITSLVKREDVDSNRHVTPADLTTDIRDDKREERDKDSLDTFADKLLDSFVKDAVKQFAEIKKSKEQKIEAANQMNGGLFGEMAEEEQEWMSSVEQKDGLPFFLPEKEELSSPELCNRPESPVLGASGQEELAKRLAELELSRELLDELGDDQDWFDEDFGLSSRREQQRLKEKEEEERLGAGRGGSSAGSAMGGMVSSPGGEQQVKTPPRPELPLPMPPKLPEQPAMVVPHSATEVEKMVYAATQEIWDSCDLGKEGALTLAQLSNPQPSQEYLGKESSSQDQEALSIRSYKKAVYDLTWEILQDIYAEDPNTDQPQWVKPRRVKSSSFHRVKTPGDINKIQEFIATEVLKLFGLTKDHNQKTDWQKMLKFGRKKRDRVDHILVQELHEEEAQWVNYDEDELFVKMQLADSIFDALLKDTANVLTLISDKRANKRDGLS
ncbi:centrosome-associated protein 350 isoform X1 [Stegastes partitus]|uniref:Centrosome-associated protein 350 isoform X1 n=1 Tax=Stegastes partitus TaxID=144197 RepID=A0A9Y4NBP2_9TELE|nr:PREDICTED: centrosome-associated protein 350 isoform X1 [Stegastes partitus]